MSYGFLALSNTCTSRNWRYSSDNKQKGLAVVLRSLLRVFQTHHLPLRRVRLRQPWLRRRYPSLRPQLRLRHLHLPTVPWIRQARLRSLQHLIPPNRQRLKATMDKYQKVRMSRTTRAAARPFLRPSRSKNPRPHPPPLLPRPFRRPQESVNTPNARVVPTKDPRPTLLPRRR